MTVNVSRWTISGSQGVVAPGPVDSEDVAIGAQSSPGLAGEYFRITGDEAFRFAVGSAATSSSPLFLPSQIQFVGPLRGGETVSVVAA